MSEIEFWQSGDWTMVFKDGELILAGDHYHADEWLQEFVGVKVVRDDAGVSIPDGRNALPTLAEVHAAADARAARVETAEAKRAEAERLLAEARELER